jgi:hypothetical protein
MDAVNFRVVPMVGKIIRYRDQQYRLVGCSTGKQMPRPSSVMAGAMKASW